MPADTLRQLEYFVAVAETGSVSRAAAPVHLSQSAMSTAIADLDRLLSVQLVMRHHAKGIRSELLYGRADSSARPRISSSGKIHRIRSSALCG
jgi:hypothetical protein